MSCVICEHPKSPAMVVHYAYTLSLRKTASHFNVNYRTLHRHLETCVYEAMKEYEESEYQAQLADVTEILTAYYTEKAKPRRRRSIIKKKVEFSWSRRGWKGCPEMVERA